MLQLSLIRDHQLDPQRGILRGQLRQPVGQSCAVARDAVVRSHPHVSGIQHQVQGAGHRRPLRTIGSSCVNCEVFGRA